MKKVKKIKTNVKPPDPAEDGIPYDKIIGVWEFYMDLKIVVNVRSRNVRYYLSFGLKSTQMFFYDWISGRKKRVASKNSSLYSDVLELLEEWRHEKLTKQLLE
jgi:hypothetical protein